MAILKFFKVPKHQRYDYKPRFWDPKKEDLKNRLDSIDATKNGNIDGAKNRISGSFRKGYTQNYAARKSQVFRSNMILLGIIAMLLVISYLFITKYLPKIVEVLENGDKI